tara:strand:- start:33278 stop:34237 length:960 start_codon:yes stop_codon:yes gene_type:complete
MISCNICNKEISNFSRKNRFDAKKKYNWIHDSTVKLAKIKSGNVFYGYCLECWHTSIFPRFDTNKLYVKKLGFKERKKAFEYYNPGSLYGSKRDLDHVVRNSKQIKYEFLRISEITNLVLQILKNKITKQKKIINIIDYGGGDGYLVDIIKSLINSKTNFNFNIKINSLNYDPAYKNKKSETKGDIILISHVLEHVHDLDSFFHELTKLSHKKTIFYIEVPDERIRILKAVFLRKKIYLDFHVNTFTKLSLQKILKKYKLGSDLSYRNNFYRGLRANVISGIAGRNVPINKSSKLNEFFSVSLLILSKLKIKFLEIMNI